MTITKSSLVEEYNGRVGAESDNGSVSSDDNRDDLIHPGDIPECEVQLHVIEQDYQANVDNSDTIFNAEPEECGSHDKETGEYEVHNRTASSSILSLQFNIPNQDGIFYEKMTDQQVSKSSEGKLNEEQSSSNSKVNNKVRVGKHECIFCQKTFRDKYHLTRHLSVHSGQKAPDCSLCMKLQNSCGCIPILLQPTLLKQHKCEFCNKTFRDKYHLNRHYPVHTNEKPYQCPVCEKKFSRKDKLTQHSVLHVVQCNSLQGVCS